MKNQSIPQSTDTARVRLILDVTYALNGELAQSMAQLLRRMVERAIGEGMLTGFTDAEVDEYSMDTAIRPDPLDEDQAADCVLDAIQSGDLMLGEIPKQMVRYGLMEPDRFTQEMQQRMSELQTH